MRLRNVPGAREAMVESEYVVNEPKEYKGRWNELFGNSNPIRIEVGMGKGRFIMQLAAENPDINYVGIEKYSSVLIRALEKQEEVQLPNIIFIRMDAEEITDVFGKCEERDWPEPPPEPVPCEYCGKLRYHRGKELNNMGDRIFWIPTAIPCNCPGAVEAREKEQLEREQEEKRKAEDEIRRRVSRLRCDSGMRGRFLERTFSNYLTPDERTAKAKETAMRYAQNFDNMGQKKNGLFILGDIGVGKTHLAAAIANDLIQRGRPVICMTMIDMLARIKATYDKREISEGEILRVYETVPLLIIDDMGKEPPTDWGVSKIYAIINARYEGYKPTIVTSNYTDTELEKRLTPQNGDDMTARATVDRLREMCEALVMEGQSWRSR